MPTTSIHRLSIRGAIIAAALGALVLPALLAQQPEPKNWTAAEDRQNMLDQLGIKNTRKGPSGQANAPNPANYDEALANPYPVLPPLLVAKDGSKVTTAKQWNEKRRPEVVEDFEREVLGRIPKNVPKVTWEVTQTVEAEVGGIPVVGRQLVGHVDNSAYPAINVDIQMSVVLPKNAKGPVPVMMMFGGGGLPGGGGAGKGGKGGPGGAAKGGDAKGKAPAAAATGKGAPGGPPPGGGAAKGKGGPGGGDPPATTQLIAAGWGYAGINPGSIQADNGQGLTRGIIGLTNKGQARKPEDWGSLRAWQWGASRGLDYLETVKEVDAKRVGIEGVSRYGKAALITMAFDQRFAMVLIGSSGEGGVSPYRRNFGEAVETLAGSGEYHWMAGNFIKYATEESTFGKMTPGDLPVDAHDLLAMCAPRLTFISYGVPEQGDALWLDQRGSYMAAIAAAPVFRLLGAKDLGAKTDDYMKEEMPAVNQGILTGQLAWRQHDGGHTDGPNWKYFIPWAEQFWK